MIHYRIVCAAVMVCGLYGFGISYTAAATDSTDFSVTQSINTIDLIPPTTPQNLMATSVSSSQIDLNWDASSDNIGVEGYQVFRDGSQIATTSLTSYSDIGLAASTTYGYFVTAFDVSLNFSTSSDTATATTLVAPTTPIVTDDSVNLGTRVYRDIAILDLSYETTEHSITLSFETDRYTRARISWGRTSSYEMGYSASDTFRQEHKTTINGLEDGTVYEVEIYLVDNRLLYEHRRTLKITTDFGPDTDAPANVTELRTTVHNDVVDLSWINPTDPDFSHVRVLSSDFFYPTHTADGWLVYEGEAESIRDDRILPESARRFYTVFSYDKSGNVSSGAVVTASRGAVPDSPLESEIDTVTDSEQSFNFDDIIFTQHGEVKPSIGGEVYLDAEKNTHISLPYELLPERLKTIVVTLKHPDDPNQVFSFLLRINASKSAYMAVIGPLEAAGIYQFTADLFDYTTKNIERTDGDVIAERNSIRNIASDRLGFIQGTDIYYLVLILAIIIGLLFLLLLWRREE